MRTISVKISEAELEQAGRLAGSMGISRAAYIRRAVARFNEVTADTIRDRRLVEASHKVRDDSMRINAEFAAIELDPGD